MMLFCEPWFASLGFFYLFFAICHWLPNGKSAGQHYDDQEPHKLCRTWLAVEARRNLDSAARSSGGWRFVTCQSVADRVMDLRTTRCCTSLLYRTSKGPSRSSETAPHLRRDGGI